MDVSGNSKEISAGRPWVLLAGAFFVIGFAVSSLFSTHSATTKGTPVYRTDDTMVAMPVVTDGWQGLTPAYHEFGVRARTIVVGTSRLCVIAVTSVGGVALSCD